MKSYARTPMKTLMAVGLALAMAIAMTAAPALAEYRTLEETLDNNFGGDTNATPRWYQTEKDGGKPVGCGNTAWAIAFGYYAAFKDMADLFNGNIRSHYNQTGRNDAFVEPPMEEIAGYTKTTYGTYQGKGWGRTLGKNMCNGLKYAKKRGYHTRCFRIRGTEFDKARHAMAWIKADKPGILLINDPKKAFSTLHYPVVEGVRIKQKKVLGKWKDRDVDYLVNLGGGDKSKWINVRQVGKDTRKRRGSFSLYLFDVSKTKLPDAKGDINLAHCKDWCAANPDKCAKCAKTVGCGKDYKKIKTWRDAGKNYYACEKRRTRTQAGKDHKAACEKWCSENEGCVKCSRKVGCGKDYDKMKSWTGYGDNYYACKKRPSRTQAGKDHKAQCEEWCAANSSCSKCSDKVGCGRGYKKIKSWTGRGKNWYACKKR